MHASTSPTESSPETTAAQEQLERGRRTTWALVATIAVSEFAGLLLLPNTLDVEARTQALAIVIFAVCSIRMLQGATIARWALSISLLVFGVMGARAVLDGAGQTTPRELVSVAQCAIRVGGAAALHLPSVAAFIEFRWHSKTCAQRGHDGR